VDRTLFSKGSLAASLLLSLFMAACGGDEPEAPAPSPPPPPKPTSVVAKVSAKQDVNPDTVGRASPVQVRVYELSDDSAFVTASFLAMYQDDQAVLGQAMQDRQEFMLSPGQSLTMRRTMKPEAKFLAVFAAFQDYDHASWRSFTEIPRSETTNLQILVGRLEIEIEKTQ
jgi:type VI secretion system protein VasD